VSSAQKTRPAGDVLHVRLVEQVGALERRDAQMRTGDAAGVHRTRVACRRLRGVLVSFRPLFDEETTDPIADEVQWLARSLGGARDEFVVQERIRRLLDEEPPDLVAGPVATRLGTTYGDRVHVPGVLLTQRYRDLRTALDALVAEPAWSDLAEKPATKVLPERLDSEWQRLRKRHAAVVDDPHDDVALHDLRKAAKRFRYAAETVEPVVGKPARRAAAAAKRLTEHLGERHDTVASRAQLVVLADAAASAGEPTFTYGRLHAREQRRADELDEGLADVWKRVTGPARRSTC
jgi:CHAD domain-containing protein